MRSPASRPKASRQRYGTQANKDCKEKLSLAAKKYKIKWKSGFCSLILERVSQTQCRQRGIQPWHSPASLPEKAIKDLGMFVRSDFFLFSAPVTAASGQRGFTRLLHYSSAICLCFWKSSLRPARLTAPSPNQRKAAGSRVSTGSSVQDRTLGTRSSNWPHVRPGTAPRHCRSPVGKARASLHAQGLLRCFGNRCGSPKPQPRLRPLRFPPCHRPF